MKPPEENLGNRLKLLEAAAETFSSSGYNGTSLRAIARRARVSFQLIQHHFGSKSDLWLAVVDYLYAGLALPDELLEFDPQSDLHAQFREHLHRMMMATLRRDSLRKIRIMEQFADSERHHDYLKPRSMEFFTSRALPYFEQAARLGVLTGVSVEEAAVLWTGIVTQNITDPDILQLCTGHPARSAPSIDRVIDLMFRICTREPSRHSDAQPTQAHARPIEADAARAHSAGARVIYPPGFQRYDERNEERDEALQFENGRLKQLVGELTLENRLLSERLKEAVRPRPHKRRPD